MSAFNLLVESLWESRGVLLRSEQHNFHTTLAACPALADMSKTIFQLHLDRGIDHVHNSRVHIRLETAGRCTASACSTLKIRLQYYTTHTRAQKP